jgi:hypothetical protein
MSSPVKSELVEHELPIETLKPVESKLAIAMPKKRCNPQLKLKITTKKPLDAIKEPENYDFLLSINPNMNINVSASECKHSGSGSNKRIYECEINPSCDVIKKIALVGGEIHYNEITNHINMLKIFHKFNDEYEFKFKIPLIYNDNLNYLMEFVNINNSKTKNSNPKKIPEEIAEKYGIFLGLFINEFNYYIIDNEYYCDNDNNIYILDFGENINFTKITLNKYKLPKITFVKMKEITSNKKLIDDYFVADENYYNTNIINLKQQYTQNFEQKYLKYKQKYLNLKKNIGY